MKDQLLQEKADLESQIRGYEGIIKDSQNYIHWLKKRLKLNSAQLKELEDKPEKPTV